MTYFCHRKQGEKIGCYRFIGTTVFGVQGGSDATLFFFGGIGAELFSSLDGVITKSAQLHWTDLFDDPWPCHGPSDNKKGTQTPLKASFQMISESFFVGDPLGISYP